MNKSILVAINEDSHEVVEYAIGMAKATGWDLVLLHVVEKQRGKAYLTTRLDNIVKACAADIWTSGVRYQTKIDVGAPEKKILEIGRKLGVSMIIAGFVNLKGVERVKAFGSISRKITENSDIPVLLVPRGREPLQHVQDQTLEVMQR
jgi:nucleotide-binding universal stress UspA family protein